MTMEDGLMAAAHADYLRPEGAFTHGDDRVRIAGEEGVLEIRGGHVYYSPETGMPGEVELEPEANVFEAFARSLEGHCEPPVTTEESLYTTAAALIAREAADMGRTVRFEEFGW